MMKKIALFFVGICGLTTAVSAQTFTNTRLLSEAATRLRLSFSANYVKAMAMAKEKGWALSITTKGGGHARLMGVTAFGEPKYVVTYSNLVAAGTTRANQLWPGGSTGLNLSGSSANMKNKLGIWDEDRVLASHVEFTGRVTQKDNPSATAEHSTHTTGTLMSAGINNPSSKGMAFGIQGIIAYDWENDLSEMASEAANLLVSNHSYGPYCGWNYNDAQARWEFYGRAGENEDYKFGYYDEESADLDDMAYNAPYYLIVKAAGNPRILNGPAVGQPYYRYDAAFKMVNAGNRPAGISSNDGYDVLVTKVAGKNVLTVGAVTGLPNGYSRKEDVVMSSFSAWGPTDDGRIKPDIVADGINVLSTSNESNTAYAIHSGTSMASPNAAGSLFLLQEYYSKLKAGAFMRSATLKGLAIHTADEAGVYDGPDYQFGWGLLNVEKAANLMTTAVASGNALTSPGRVYENTLAQGASFSIPVIASGKGKLQATISWTDVKGTVEQTNVLNNRTKKLVNDLDIRITKGTRTYYPWTLSYVNPEAPAIQGDNITDNVERIDIDSTLPGQTYTITVTHKGTLVKGPQAYSLIVSGAGGTAYCTSASGGGGARIDSVGFRNIQVKNTAGSKTYTDNTSYIANIEPGQNVPIAIRVNTADATTASRIVKVFIDFNNNGVFDLPGELVATSSVLTAASQVYTPTLAIPNTVTMGSLALMRIIVQETATATDINPCGTYAKGETQDYLVRVVSPSNDMLINAINAPQANDCGTGIQYLTLNLKNNGGVAQSNIPVSVSIGTNNTVLTSVNFTYPGPVAALSEVPYTFQVPVATAGATAYTITATVSLPTDQLLSNNTLVSIITTAAKPATPAAVAANCGTNVVNLKVSPANPDLNYFWYTTATGTSPFASGSVVSTTSRTSNNTYYVQSGAKITAGLANKTVYPSGGYNVFRGNYIKINNSVPVTIESARMYVSYPGTVRVTLANIVSEDLATGNYSYLPLAVSNVEVYPTTPNVVPGLVNTNSAADTGAIFRLNLPVASIGDHVLVIECLPSQGRPDSASIFRNNGIASTNATYPLGATNIFTITGNSAHTPGVSEASFYYFFYDMKVSTFDCVSDRVAVTATAASVTITRVGNVLQGSSTTTGTSQWFKNAVAITGATSLNYTPTENATYYLVVTDALGCTTKSNEINYTLTAAIDVTAREIKLSVSPNPNNGVFNLSFEVTTKADLSIDVLSASGQSVYNSKYPNFVGKFSKTITLRELSSEFYILKITHDKKTYLQKLLIQR